MALPASGPISGSQIAAEFGEAATNISTGGLADSASLSAPDAYSDFYGMSGQTWSAITTSKKSQTSSVNACTQTINWTRYTDGSPTSVAVGDKFALNSDGTGTVGSGWFRYGAGFTTKTYYLNDASSSEVTSTSVC
jgi:hypothetical protein